MKPTDPCDWPPITSNSESYRKVHELVVHVGRYGEALPPSSVCVHCFTGGEKTTDFCPLIFGER